MAELKNTLGNKNSVKHKKETQNSSPLSLLAYNFLSSLTILIKILINILIDLILSDNCEA